MRPGIYLLPVPIPNNPLGNTNAYLVQGDNEYLLIDPGTNNEEGFDALKRELSAIGVGVDAITQTIATHSHGDHYGLCGRVKQLSQARILLHHLARDEIQLMSANTEERGQQMEQWLQLNGVPSLDPSQFQMGMLRMPRFTAPTMPDVILQGGETIPIGNFSLRVVWTPGHSPGHICLYESNQKILFSGDHILPVITPHVSVQPPLSSANPLGDFLNSLNVVKQLDVNLVLPAHESPFNELQPRVEELFAHHAHRNWEILETIKGEPKTAYQISDGITWMPEMGGVSFQSLAPGDRRMAVTETLAHLEYLRVEGRVNKFPRDSIIYYQLT